MPFTARALEVVRLASDEPAEPGQEAVGAEHVLLAINREGNGLAAQILIKLGPNLEVTRTMVMQEQRDQPGGP